METKLGPGDGWTPGPFGELSELVENPAELEFQLPPLSERARDQVAMCPKHAGESLQPAERGGQALEESVSSPFYLWVKKNNRTSMQWISQCLL